MYRLILILSFLSLFICCKSKTIINTNDSILKNDSINLYAFIGKKISVEDAYEEIKYFFEIDKKTGDTIYSKTTNFFQRHIGSYEVIKNVYNDLRRDTIVFMGYDHFGNPKFKAYDYVLLYLTFNESDSTYYHDKNQYQVVKQTKDGHWIGENGETLAALFEKNNYLIEKSRIIFK